MLKVQWTSKFKKDYKHCINCGLDINKLDEVIRLLANKQELPIKYKDHKLKGDYDNFRELHVEPDWLLIYSIDNKILTLTLIRTGSHTNLF